MWTLRIHLSDPVLLGPGKTLGAHLGAGHVKSGKHNSSHDHMFHNASLGIRALNRPHLCSHPPPPPPPPPPSPAPRPAPPRPHLYRDALLQLLPAGHAHVLQLQQLLRAVTVTSNPSFNGYGTFDSTRTNPSHASTQTITDQQAQLCANGSLVKVQQASKAQLQHRRQVVASLSPSTDMHWQAPSAPARPHLPADVPLLVAAPQRPPLHHRHPQTPRRQRCRSEDAQRAAAHHGVVLRPATGTAAAAVLLEGNSPGAGPRRGGRG